MQIKITPTPQHNTIIFAQVDCYENQKVKTAEGKTVTTMVKTCILKMVMSEKEKVILSRINRKFPKCDPVLIKCKILSETKR